MKLHPFLQGHMRDVALSRSAVLTVGGGNVPAKVNILQTKMDTAPGLGFGCQ